MATKVSDIKQFQQRSEELKQRGYVAVRPDDFIRPATGGANAFSWKDYVHQQLISTESRSTDGGSGMSSAARRQVSTVFASSGGENLATPKDVGTDGLGFMEWGAGNRLPNIIWLLSRMSPFTAAGIDFIKKIIVGHGPKAKYHYTQYVGGNITEKYIPYETAGVLLRGQLADLKSQENPDKQAIDALQQSLDEWERTNAQLQRFLDDNDIMDTYLQLAGDMSLMSQCFVELQLNQKQLNDDGVPVPTSQWTPKIVGIKPRSIFTTRLERMDDNYRINYAYLSNQWLDQTQSRTNLRPEDLKIAAVPFLPAQTAVKDLQRKVREARQQRVGRKARPTRFIMSPRDFGGPYYADALWHSIFAGSIFEYAFTIVDDRLTRKRNSNVIGRVIYIHQDYVATLIRQEEQLQNGKKRSPKDIVGELFQSINQWLSNSDNAGQALVSSVFTGSDGSEHKAWEVVEIESKANDQANADKTELQEISSIIFFAMGLDSKLIGNTPGDASSSGGTDLRERFLVKQIQFAPLQQQMIRPLEVISRFNEWDSHLVWQIDREVLTTLDNSKTGVTTQE